MQDLYKVIKFLKIAMRMKETYRFTPKPDGGFENDAEHSWNVALVCMTLSSRLEKEFDVKVDTLRMIKMSIIHDLAEVLTGDTKTWDTKARMGKNEREKLAITKILSELPEDLQVELRELWDECEKKETLEAKVVKSIDRMEPVLHRTFLGLGWENLEEEGDNGSVTALDERQIARHSFSKLLTELYEEVRDEAVNKQMFPTT